MRKAGYPRLVSFLDANLGTRYRHPHINAVGTRLLQPRRSPSRLLSGWHIQIRVLPQIKKLAVRSLGLRPIARQHIGPSQPKMRESANWLVAHHSAMVEDPLKLGGRGLDCFAAR